MTLAEVAAATDGIVHGDPERTVTGAVVTDSRAVTAGALFTAIVGARTDGHEHAPEAVRAGAAAVLCQRSLPGIDCVVVADPVAALGSLAATVLRSLPGLTVVGVTGSVGKTSTKDLIAGLLAPAGPTIAAAGSFNNDLGLPLTVLRAESQTRFLVLEYSARGLGHIARLTRIAPPRIAVELNVGSAHAGEFGSRAVTAQAKGELVEALPADGVAVLNADDPLVLAMADRTSARVVTTGTAAGADVRAVDIAVDSSGRASFTLVTSALRGGDARAQVRLGLVGEHHVANAVAAAAVGLQVGRDLAQIADGLSRATPASRWRMEVTDRADGVTVVNDAYNANPESMAAALKALASMTRERRSWAVLGEMGELGAESTPAHDRLGRLAVRLGVDRLVCVGDAAGPVGRLHAGAVLEGSWGQESVHVPDPDAALALLRAELRPGDVVLVKASRSVGLERLADALLTEPGPVRS